MIICATVILVRLARRLWEEFGPKWPVSVLQLTCAVKSFNVCDFPMNTEGSILG